MVGKIVQRELTVVRLSRLSNRRTLGDGNIEYSVWERWILVTGAEEAAPFRLTPLCLPFLLLVYP